ncbi:MAG: hypothetical protein DRR08_17295 [Candidatus Parabeggiatoa sp. nov. 2]|nr:MAG: hypothetical protein B6247_06455 [Beggiatoa sp. 4572_84]RKZ58102.1 MAG: hypothetical protein DRR08_17295 [Gammaproteobacteria bacterium]
MIQELFWRTQLQLKDSRESLFWKIKISLGISNFTKASQLIFIISQLIAFIIPSPVRLLLRVFWVVILRLFGLFFLIRKHIFLIILFIVIPYWLYVVIYGNQILTEYQQKHVKFSAAALYDANKNFLGLIPSLEGGKASEEHKSLYVPNIPETWWDVLVALEDENLNNWLLSWGGIDISAFPRALFFWMTTNKISGGSSLSMQLVRSINHQPPRAGTWTKIARKIKEVSHSPILMSRLKHNDRREFKLWLAMHVPLVQGTRHSNMGSELYGLGVSARVVFAKKPEHLNMGEQAILAAAFKKHILLGPEPDNKTVLNRWNYLIERAAYGLKKAYQYNPNKQKQANKELDALKEQMLTQLPPYGPISLINLYPEDEIKRFSITANPAMRRNTYFALSEIRLAIAELKVLYGTDWPQKIDSVYLTTSKNNVKFKRKVESQLKQIQKNLRNQLQINLVKSSDEEIFAQVVLALANEQGRIIRFYQNYHTPIYATIKRPIASLGKLPVAVFLGYSGDNPKTTYYCNHSYPNTRNPDGSLGVENCHQPNVSFSPRNTFAGSWNLPLIHRLKPVPKTTLETLRDRFGLTTTSTDETELRRALALGTVTASPRTMHSIMHTLITGIKNAVPQQLQPSILGRVEEILPDGTVQGVKPKSKPSIHEIEVYFREPNTKYFLHEVLSEVLKTRYRGTLKSLVHWTPARHKYVDIHIAKTGTHSAETGETLEKYITGGLVWKGNVYSYFLLIGAPNPTAPLGSNLSTSQFASLIQLSLDSLE